jgi:hypothetical protein
VQHDEGIGAKGKDGGVFPGLETLVIYQVVDRFNEVEDFVTIADAYNMVSFIAIYFPFVPIYKSIHLN